MTTRTRVTISVVLVAAGFFIGVVLSSFLVTDSEREAQLSQDAAELVRVLRPTGDQLYQLSDEFWDAWNPRRKLYEPEGLEELRRRLNVYVDFVQAEHADAAEIWTSGNRDVLSDTARSARDALSEAYGPIAESMIVDGEKLREEAYRASPEVAGYDPALPHYDELRRAVADALPELRRRVEALTEPL